MKLLESILKRMKDISKPQMKFMLTLFKTVMSLSGRVNFTNMSRYSDLNERTYSRNFRRCFDFSCFNNLIVEETYDPRKQYILALDPSFIPKSGKKTYGLGKFWNSAANRAMKGLEISSIAMIDVNDKTAYTLNVQQVIPSSEDSEDTAIDFFLKQVKTLKSQQRSFRLPIHLAVDGYFFKQRFAGAIKDIGFHLICKARKDANCRYLYHAPKSVKPGRGRPRQYAGKINWKALDLSLFEFVEHINESISLYSCIVYSVCLKEKIKLVYVLRTDKKKRESYALLFSTDLTLEAKLIYQFYKARFQIEFTFRDAKPFLGLTHCQARDKESLHFHFNMSLALLNLIRAEHVLKKPPNQESFSMASYKRRYANEMLLELFLSKLDFQLSCQKIQTAYQELRHYGAIAA